MSTYGPVLIMQLPEQLDSMGAGMFMQELEPLLDIQFPRIVFDCSEVRYVDRVGLEPMLRYVEEVRKHEGDLKLASLSPEAQAILQLMRDARVFEAFATSDDAVQSFSSLIPAKGVQNISTAPNFSLEPGNLQKAS